MATIEDIKKMIVREFDKRTNDNVRGKIDFFKNAEVLDSIAKTYLYYANNFSDPIDSSLVVGGDRISRILNKSLPTSMAELYLDRLLLNMLEIGVTKDAKGLVEDSAILLNMESMNRQLNYWKRDVKYSDNDLDVLKERADIVKNNLNSKVVLHELSHMSAIPSAFGQAGFYGGTHKKDVQTYASRFEEICAEATALNVTCQKIPSHINIQSGNIRVEVGGYNPESSNYPISSFIELAPFAFGKADLEIGRMLNPQEYMKKLNSSNARFARDGGTFAGRVQEDLKAIVDNKEYGRISKLQADFIRIGMTRITKADYLNTCSENQFKQDVGFMLRLEPLLYRQYENNQLKITDNIDCYNRAMADIAKMFDLLKTKRNMFSKCSSFEEFKAGGLMAIENNKRKSLGLEPINRNMGDINPDKSVSETSIIVKGTSNAGTARPPHMDSEEIKVVSVEPESTIIQQTASNQVGYTYKTIDVKNTSIGEISKEKHFENVKYQFVCETINNLFGNENTGMCAIKPKDPQNIEIIKRARRVWQAMAYDNGMRMVAPNGAEISVRDMLRKYYQEADGYKQDRIVTNLLPNPNIPDEIKSLFEDLYATRGLYEMAEIIEHDVDLAIGRTPNDVISKTVHSYSDYDPKRWMTIFEYDEQCRMGDIQFETARYLQQDYNLLGGYTNSTNEQREYSQSSQEMLIDWLSKSLDIAKSREERLSGMGENSI